MRLYSRPGNDLTHRFPLIVDALARLRSRSCIIELIATIAINTFEMNLLGPALFPHHESTIS